MQFPTTPLLHRICETVRYMTRWLSAILTILNSSSQVRLLWKEPNTRIWDRPHRPVNVNIKASLTRIEYDKIWAVLPTGLDTELSGMSWNLEIRWNLMLGASCSLKWSEMVLIEHRKPWRDWKLSWYQAYQRIYQVLVFSWVNEDGIKTILKSLQLAGPKKSNPHTLVQVESGLVLTPWPMNPR